MAQMGHPYSAKVKASQARRLRALGARAGKSWGNQAMQQKTSLPSTNAGTERPMTLSGGSAKKRADRYAKGGRVKGKGSTTNIIIAQPGAANQGPHPVPVPVPVGEGPSMPMGGPPAPAAAPAMAGPPMPLAGARPPGLPSGPPGLASGGAFHNWGTGYKKGGVVKKADGGFLKDSAPSGYPGYPHSPTTGTNDAVSALKKGGAVKKRQMGGPMAAPMPPGARVAGSPMPPVPSNMLGKRPMAPPPGLGGGKFKKGGGFPHMKAGAGSGEGRLEQSEKVEEKEE